MIAAPTAVSSTLASLSIAASVVSAGLQGISAFQSGKSQAAIAGYQAALSDRDAAVAKMQAQDALMRGEDEKTQLRERLSILEGEGRASFGASGVVLGEGSPLDWAMDLAEQGQDEEAVIDYNAQMEAWGFRNQAAGHTASAGISRASAANAYTSGVLGAGTSVLGGIGSVADKYYKYSR